MQSFPPLSFSQIQQDLKTGTYTCVDLVKAYLQNIVATQQLNIYLDIYGEEALEKAAEIDQKIKNNTAGKLAGMIIGLKDVLAYKDHGLQAGSKILQNFQSKFTGTAVQRLLDQDAIFIGRQNCDEFAMGSSNENSAFGPTLNADDPTRVPGGSSGASAVAVQANTCLISIGSDTGGSVRQPGAFCGVVGLKPTYGRVSRWGLAAYASSFDCIGPIGQNVEDTALVLEIMAGADAQDATVSNLPVDAYFQKSQQPISKKLRIAYLKEAIENEGLSAEIKEAIQLKIEALRAEGHHVEAIDFPLIAYALPAYYILTTAEASSNLSRYDGVRFGHRTSSATDIVSLYKKSRAEGFGPEVKKRIMLGTFVLSADYYDAYYTKAQRVRRLITDATNEVLSTFDFIISPTTPTTAFKIGEKSDNQLEMFLTDLYTVHANVTGQPAISIPIARSKEGLSIGMQVYAKHFDEAAMLQFAHHLIRLS